MDRVLTIRKTENKTPVRYFEGLKWWILAAVFVANIFFQLSEVSSSLFLYMGTFVMIGMLFFLDKDEYIYLTVSLLSVLRYSQIFNVSVINIITFAYFFKTYVFENQYKSEQEKGRLSRHIVIAGTVFILYSLVYITSDFRTTLTIVKLLFFLIYMVDVFRNMKDCKDPEKHFMSIQVYYVAGVLIAVLAATIINPGFSREAARMSLSDGAVNQLGISLASCLAFVTLGMTKVKNIKEWSVLAITALPLLYFCFETQSRTSIIGLIFIFGTTAFLGVFQKDARPWIIMMVIGSVAVLGGLILFAEGTELHENIMATIERFVNPKYDDISNGRFKLWELYINKFSDEPKLFFVGGTLEDFGGMQPHNMFIEIFANYGFFGFAIVSWIYVTLFFEIYKAASLGGKRKIRLLGFVPFALVFIIGMASHSLLNTEPTVNFCLGTAMIYFYGERVEEKSEINTKHRMNKNHRQYNGSGMLKYRSKQI